MEDIQLVSRALMVVHDPSSSSEQRAEAQAFLDALKSRPNAAAIGCSLAAPQYDGTVRHFGLSLLQHSLHHQIASMAKADIQHIRQVLLGLAQQENPPHYIREKVAVLIVYLAKQTWGTQANPWMDLDRQLLGLWSRPLVVLSVLSTLFEDVYILDDPIAARRGPNFSVLCSSIVLNLKQAEDIHGPGYLEFRASEEGWLERIISATKTAEPPILTKLLETLKSIVPWVPLDVSTGSRITDLLLSCLNKQSVDVRVLASDCLHIVLTRRLDKPEFDAIVGKFMSTEGLTWVQQVYNRIKIDPNAIDDLEYVFLKKLVEMTLGMGDYIENPKRQRFIEEADYKLYFDLLLDFAAHPSLIASGLSLQFWCGLLRLDVAPIQREDAVPRLLSIASDRCIHYEYTSPDSDAQLFMEFDFTAQQEAKIFFGNYRRYMSDIIRLLVCHNPTYVLDFLHDRVSSFFNSEIGQRAVTQQLQTGDPAYIYALSMIDNVEAAVRGVARWQLLSSHSLEEPKVMQMSEQWAIEMINLRFVDTSLHRKLVECLVQFAPLFTKQPSANNILFKILERVLEACTQTLPTDDPDDEWRQKVIELRASSGTELNRLAYMIPEALMGIYDQLEGVIGQLLMGGEVREQESVLFKSFLLVVSQRSSLPDKKTPFERIVDPVLASWTDEATVKGLNNLEWFMERVGIVAIAQYFQSRGILADTNLLATKMDDEGRKLKAELAKKWQAIFPIRPTRIFIQYPIEKLDHASPEFQHLLRMWKPRVQQFLPHILQLTRQIVAYHNPENWSQLPPHVQTFVKTSCAERFWQVGVSMQSKDEFEKDNAEASKTLRDFADSVGHIVRYTREYAFLTLGSISQLDETMYEMEGMGNTLYQAIAGGDTRGITSHCWRHTISIVVRNVIKNCPPEYMQKFLSPFVSQFLNTLQSVLIEKWAHLAQAGYQLMDEEMMTQIDQEDQTLSDEMMSEHLLRQLTAMTVRLLIDLAKLDNQNKRLRLVRQVALDDTPMLMSILTTCRAILSFKDSRCCYNVCLVLRDLMYYKGTDILKKDPQVYEYFGNEIIPALLQVFFDEYFHESALEAGNVMTYIYEDSPQLLYQPFSRLGMSKSGQSLADFNTNMQAAVILEQRRGIIMDFLGGFKAKSDDEDANRSKLLKKAQQQRVSNRVKPSFEDSYDAAATISLFNQD